MSKYRGQTKVFIEINCMLTIEMIKEKLKVTQSMTIVKKIKILYRQFEAVKIQFVHKKNTITDSLARLCSSNDVNLIIIDIT